MTRHMRTVRIGTPSKAYDVLLGRGLLDEAGELAARAVPVGAAALVTDDTVDALYSERLAVSLKSAGFRVVKHVFPAGEAAKNAENYIKLLEFLAENGLSRSDTVFALGGGVAGDLAGFAAATYLRGLGLVQVPTTLLAMADSSVGGKTGIDLKAGKNLAGAFYQPDLVLCDGSVLATLPGERQADGWAEIIKYGMICDGDLLNALDKRGGRGLDDIEDIIVRCVKIKSGIVGADEREGGLRKLLNFGHTVGHAIEKCSGYAVSHGAAVAAGMAVVTRAAVKKGLCGEDCLAFLVRLLKKYGLPENIDCGETELFQALLSDKKRSAGGITLVAPEYAGKCVLRTVPLDEARAFLRLGLATSDCP